MYMALKQKEESGDIIINIPCESTVRKVMDEIGLIHYTTGIIIQETNLKSA